MVVDIECSIATLSVILSRSIKLLNYKKEHPMSALNQSSPAPRWKFKLSLDGWAVTAAFVVSALVRFGVVKRIPW
jgi:hypothetical protein